MGKFLPLALLRQSRKFSHVRLLKLVRLRLSVRIRNKVHAKAIPTPETASWMHCYDHGDDESMIAFTSLDRETFEYVLQIFSRHYKRNRQGRPQRLVRHD